MPRHKLETSSRSESTMTPCDTTTQPPAVDHYKEQQQQHYKEQQQLPQSVNYFPEAPSDQRHFRRHNHHKNTSPLRRTRCQGDDRNANRFTSNSGQTNTHSKSHLLTRDISEDADQDFSSDDESHDSMHQSHFGNNGVLGDGIDGDKTMPIFQEIPGSRSKVPEDVRLRINSRERQRMHDLNSALDSLRQVMPYSSGPSVKKLSKMSTLLLARNYIVMLTRSLEEMKRLLQEMPLARRPLPPASLPPPPPPTASTVSQPHQPIPAALSSLPLLSNPSIYAALLSSHAATTGGFLIPSPFVQASHMIPTTSSLPHHHHHHQHHHDIAGLLSCTCYYCKKPRSSVTSS